MSIRRVSGLDLLLAGGWRFYRQHPGQLLLTIAGIALGVATVVAIDLAAHSARQAFDATTQLLRGQATHYLERPGGYINESVLGELRRQWRLPASVPVLERSLRFARQPGRSVTMLATDPLAATRLNTGLGNTESTSARPTLELMAEPGSVLLTNALARELDVGAGDQLALIEPADVMRLTVAGLLPAEEGARFVVADLATAQRLFGRPGELSRIDLQVPTAQEARLATAMASRGLRLQTVAQRLGQFDGMTRSFRINLQALSLLALLVGAFLVYSTVSFTVVRRRATFGLLRALGASRPLIYAQVVLEALCLAAVGCLLGVLFGGVLGAGLVDLVSRTIGDLYLRSAVDKFGWSAFAVFKAVGVASAACLLAAFLPAREASQTTPHSGMQRASLERRRLKQLPLQVGGACACGLGGALVLANTSALEYAFAGIFLVLVAAALLTPALLIVMTQAVAAVGDRADGFWLAYAARSLAASLSRTGPSAAALMIAVAAFTGIGVMIGSFRASVDDWLNYSVDADVLIRVPTALNPSESEEFWARLTTLEGLAGATLSRRTALPDGDGLAGLLAIQSHPQAGRWPKSETPRDQILAQLSSGDTIIVSEPLAQKRGLAVGDQLNLLTPGGTVAFTVAAQFIDYTSELGLAAMDLSVYRRHFADQRIDTVSLHAERGQSEALLADARTALADFAGVQVADAGLLRGFVLQIFDRTFTITEVLRTIAGLVAVMAIFNALQAQRLETRRETGLLRAGGLTARSVTAISLLQTGLLGLGAGLVALPVGLTLAWLLIFVVNRLAFGWSMMFLPQPGVLLQSLVLATAAGIAAGWWPARAQVSQPPAVDLRAA